MKAQEILEAGFEFFGIDPKYIRNGRMTYTHGHQWNAILAIMYTCAEPKQSSAQLARLIKRDSSIIRRARKLLLCDSEVRDRALIFAKKLGFENKIIE